MIRVSEGKYRIGDTKVLIFVRVSLIGSLFILLLIIMIYVKTVMGKSNCFLLQLALGLKIIA